MFVVRSGSQPVALTARVKRKYNDLVCLQTTTITNPIVSPHFEVKSCCYSLSNFAVQTQPHSYGSIIPIFFSLQKCIHLDTYSEEACYFLKK